jgi:diguanylate cyclase (GGDEF)-like protein/PAS domain S-box-containing protein
MVKKAGLEQPDLRELLDHLYDGVYFVDRERKITFWNRAAERITGYSAGEVIGTCCQDNLLNHVDADGNSLCEGRCPLVKATEEGVPIEAEVFLHHKDGHRVPVAVRINPLRNQKGEILGSVELFEDLSEKTGILLQLEELRRQAQVDSLTGLASRGFLENEIESQLEELRRYGRTFGVLFLDADNFKTINDNYGHGFGDQVLKMVAANLKSICRPFDIFGRWGGEEFVGLVRNVKISELAAIGERLRMLIEKSFLPLANEKISITVSVGATLARKDDCLKSLVLRADQLMYQSKQRGKNCLTVSC